MLPAETLPSPLAPSEPLIAARDGAVSCDLAALSVVSASGADAAVFLHGQLSSDVTGLGVGRAQYTSFNSPKGRMLANFVLWREAADEFRALLPHDIAGSVTKRLGMFVLRSRVALADVSESCIRFGVGGPKGEDAIRAAFGAAPDPLAVSHAQGASLLALPGPRYVVMASPDSAPAVEQRLSDAAVRAPFAVWQWLTIRAGVPVVTAALQDQLIAQSANWDLLDGINFKKGCYTGQEIIARMQYLGRQKERLFAFHTDTLTEPGARLFSSAFGDQPCGVVVNAAPSPESGNDLLAVVQLVAVAAGDLRLGAPDGAALTSRPLPYAVPAAGSASPRADRLK